MTAAVAMIPYTNMAPYRQLGEPDVDAGSCRWSPGRALRPFLRERWPPLPFRWAG